MKNIMNGIVFIFILGNRYLIQYLVFYLTDTSIPMVAGMLQKYFFMFYIFFLKNYVYLYSMKK